MFDPSRKEQVFAIWIAQQSDSVKVLLNVLMLIVLHRNPTFSGVLEGLIRLSKQLSDPNAAWQLKVYSSNSTVNDKLSIWAHVQCKVMLLDLT